VAGMAALKTQGNPLNPATSRICCKANTEMENPSLKVEM
jgi:hypothetical protein